MNKLPVLACLVIVASASHAQTPAVARDAAASCRTCHTQSLAGAGAIPALDALPRDVIVARMLEFRAGGRAGTVMPQLARGYTDAQVEMIATALSTTPR
ncbi:MAG TPA: cytochrome C [Casimicrobiaceae bacterium]|nr:cytochrome C [Casimicrobiaceae bacterium]